MDITLVRQGTYHKENVAGKDIECISESDISNLSKSFLRILYSCGKRPLYVSKDPTSDWQVSVEEKPQKLPDCILCGKSNISHQSARVIQKQMRSVGFPVEIKKLDSLGETALSEKQLKHHYARLIKNTFESLDKKGIQHVIVIAEPNKLNAIASALTNQDSSWEEGIFVKAIKDGNLAYQYNPQNPEYITDGMLDSLMIHMVNGSDCPEKLKKFSGKIHYPIHSTHLSHEFKKRFLEKQKFSSRTE